MISEEPEKAEVIVVLNGRDAERSLTAVDLYNGGYGNLIVIARGPKQPGCDEFFKRVGPNWDSKTFFQRSIEAMGVPDRSFRLIGNGVTSTFEEAKAVRTFFRENGFKSMLLVTSKWHSRRAYSTFRSVFDKNKDVRIIIQASKYDTFDPKKWWQSDADAEIVLGEYLRLIYYVATFRISLFG